jgi:hypothetical protein
MQTGNCTPLAVGATHVYFVGDGALKRAAK